jgi:acyl-CoA reductase-like NAD-dependent aldehyde dehydrogenase
MERLKHFVGGKFVESKGEEFLLDVNPSDASDRIAEVPRGTAEDTASAVSAANEAFPPWSSRTGSARGEFLYRWAEVLAKEEKRLALVMCREVGKPLTEARGEAARCVAILRYFAGEAVHPSGEVIPSQLENTLQFTMRGPVGVVGLITPWNFPAAIPLWKAAPALALGNTVVWKASELSPCISALLVETAVEARLPRGVFNLLLGTGEGTGEALLEAAGISAVSFTGSFRVGKHVASVLAQRGIRYQTEMGGKNCAIVLKDADLGLAARLVAGGAMRYAGQKCTATSRVIVAKEVFSEFRKKLEEAISKLPLGPASDPETAIGPLISQESRARLTEIRNQVAWQSIFEVAVPSEDSFTRGFFFPPTVIYNARPDSRVATEELFGPVLVVFEAEDLEHAIALANGTRFGLSATLFTRDVHSVLRYLGKIEAGLVRVNGDTTGVDPHAPFGGMKQSGSGGREQGTAAREFYTEVRTIQIQG